jgi:hypothetical protein
VVEGLDQSAELEEDPDFYFEVFCGYFTLLLLCVSWASSREVVVIPSVPRGRGFLIDSAFFCSASSFYLLF